MVFVTVSNDKSLYAVNVFNDVRIVWDNIVDTEKIILGEFNTCIDNDNFILVLNTIGVFTDFPQTTNRINPNFFSF